MRIAVIGCKGIPAVAGGVERVVEEVGAEMAARGHDVIVYARRGQYPGPAPERVRGMRVITTAGVPGKHTDAITHTATAAWDLLQRNVDVVHLYSPGPALLSFLPAARRVPVVFTIQGPDWEGPRWSRPARLALSAGLACGMRFASVVTTVSLSIADFLADKYHREVTCVPNGVRPARVRKPDIISGWGLRPEGYALNVGRIVRGKGVDLLVRTWAGLDLDMPLVIVGDMDQEPGYAARCRRYTDNRIRFVGPCFGPTLEELYSNASLVVQPSRWEGMSLVLLEAASYERPVVAREMPANREALGEAMIAFQGESAEALGGAIIKCVGDEQLRRQVARLARKRVTARFSWPRIADEYERLYRCAAQTC
ncbi:hypothetical protein LCGC14_2526320 [marine sediment metagenome]|uniref:Glycosyltransferase subfamily 4-like N-terminal domain-containing protein n=1 Tax=marine sediment metagenome TaxID=412755 RepID=A0A0F9D6G6_9ZZZZ